MTKVAVASTTFSANPELRRSLVTQFTDVKFNETGRVLAGAELLEFLRDGTAAIIGLERIDRALLDQCPALQAIAKFGVGLDNIDLATCGERRIAVLSTPGVNALAVGELALGLMLGVARRIAITTHQLKSGHWLRNGGVQVVGKRIGVIGLGHTGRQTARLTQAIGCSVIAHDIADVSDHAASHGIELCSLGDLLARADFVSLHVPLTERTRQMIGQPQLEQMQPNAFLINTARGGIVDEIALADALERGQIAGAAFDVFAEEPTNNARLLRCDNFIATAHTGGNSREAIEAVGRAAITNLAAHFAGRRD